ncbi:unnamed protein product [Mucor hiemalis]
MAMPNPVYASPAYASPSLPQMVTTPYYAGPSPYPPTMMSAQQTPGYYPPMGAMQMSGQPVMYQQPYPVYAQSRHPCDCCCDCGTCCLGLFTSLCICCCCCGNEVDECCC